MQIGKQVLKAMENSFISEIVNRGICLKMHTYRCIFTSCRHGYAPDTHRKRIVLNTHHFS